MVLKALDDPANKIVRAAGHLMRSRAARERAHQTVLEGPRLVEEAVRAGGRIRSVLYSSRLVRRREGQALLESLTGGAVRTVYVTDRLLDSLSEVERHQGILAVAELDIPAERDLQAGPVLVADAVQDPGNLGAMLRTAAAFGFRVGVTEGTVDPFNPKVMRSSAGGVFHCRLTKLEPGFQVAPDLTLVAADAHEGVDYRIFEWSERCVLILGNEGAGVGQVIQEMKPTRVRIPMAGRTESLNVAVAAGILMAEAQSRFTHARDRGTVH